MDRPESHGQRQVTLIAHKVPQAANHLKEENLRLHATCPTIAWSVSRRRRRTATNRRLNSRNITHRRRLVKLKHTASKLMNELIINSFNTHQTQTTHKTLTHGIAIPDSGDSNTLMPEKRRKVLNSIKNNPKRRSGDNRNPRSPSDWSVYPGR